jgi:trigger factor
MLQVNVQELEPCKVALSIQIPPEQVAKTVDTVFARFVKQASVPGFRKGKAPRNLAARYIDNDMVRQMAMEQLLNEAYRQALDEKGLDPFADPEVEVGEYTEGEALSFTATVPLRPLVEVGDYKGIELKRVLVPITDTDVERELERLVQSSAHYHDTEEPAQEGDRVLANVRITVDGEVVEDGSATNAWLIVGNNFAEFDAQLTGIGPGETREFAFTYPENFSVAERAGKEAQASVEAQRLQRRHVPDLNDEFAVSLGVPSVEELRARIREDFQKQAERQADDYLEAELIEKVVERSTVHFPQSMVDEEVAESMRRLITNLEGRKLTLDEYLGGTKKDLATLEGEFAEEGRRRVGNTLVLNAVGAEQKFTVTEEDVEHELQQRAQRIGADPDVMRRIMEKQEELSSLRNSIFIQKILDYLKSVSIIQEGT